MQLNLPIHSYQLRSKPASPSRLVNCYPELMPPGGKTPVMITRTPGVRLWVTVGNGPIRGLYAATIELNGTKQSYLYVISGSKLFYVKANGQATVIGDIGDPGNVDFSSNTDSLVVVNEPDGYYWNGGTLGKITDADFVSRGAGDVEFLDNFLLFREPNSGRFFAADIGSATSFDSLQFAKADAFPDELVGMKALHRILYNFGSKTLELWENTGASGFPIERIVNGTVEKGCLNARTVAELDNSLYWVADDYTVRRLDGLTPMRISTHAVEKALAAATETSLKAFAYTQEGHFFYVLTYDEGTFVFDAVTGEWAERLSYGKSRWMIDSYALFNGLHIVGDAESNQLGYLDLDYQLDWGSTQRCEWTYQPVYAQGQRAFHDRLEIILETGAGQATGQGSNPKIMLQYSDDGGRSWKAMPDRGIGAKGKTETRAVWHNLGSSRDRVYRCAVSDPVPVTVVDTQLEIRGGRL